MSLDNSTYDQIDSYLSGKMSSDDVANFEAKMATDINLSDEVRTMRFANERLLDYKIASIYTMMEARNPYKNATQKPVNDSNHLIKWVGGAILATGLILGGYWISSEKEIDTIDTPISSQSKDRKTSSDSDIQTVITPESPNFESKKTTSDVTVVTEVDEQTLENQDPGNEEPKEGRSTSKVDSIVTQSKPDSIIPVAINVCDGVKITADPLPAKTCIGKSEGEIFIPFTKINGGTYPYEFSLNDRLNYSKKNSFSGLDIGEYRVFLRDVNGCQSAPVVVSIEGKRCGELEAESFNPDVALWEFPVDDFEYCLIEVVNASGRMIYKYRMNGDEAPRWDGRNLSGSEQPSDIYVYQIKYDDGRLEKGYINLVR